MCNQIPTELYLRAPPGSSQTIEHVCGLAAGRSHRDAIAVAVAPSNISQASSLLFGTGIGVVSTLSHIASSDFLAAARLSVATGATEIALPRVVLDDQDAIAKLQTFLGSSIPLTVNITSTTGDADLTGAEKALLLGVDFVAFSPTSETSNSASQTANLIALAGELQMGGLKVAGASDHHDAVLRSSRWAMSPGNSRRCLPVAPRP